MRTGRGDVVYTSNSRFLLADVLILNTSSEIEKGHKISRTHGIFYAPFIGDYVEPSQPQ